MRIIGGSAGGRIFRAPKGLPVRPTTDRTKEALFNYLEHRIRWDQIKVLDLFAGIGSLGLESASRGATETVSVEQNHKCVAFIKTTSGQFGLHNHRVIKREVRAYLSETQEVFDLILADPPYDLPWINELWPRIKASNALHAESMVIIEHAKGAISPIPEDCIEQRSYGQSIISIFRISHPD